MTQETMRRILIHTRHPLAFSLVALLAAGASLLWATGPEVPLPGNTLAAKRLVILISAELGQAYEPHPRQSGGLAALAGYVRAERRRLTDEAGGLVLAHVGRISDPALQATSTRPLTPRGLDLVRHLGFDAILIDPRERAVLKGAALSLPFVDFGAKGSARFQRFRIVERGALDVLLTGQELSPATTRAASVSSLARMMHRNRAAHAQVLLLSRDPSSIKAARRSFLSRLLDLRPDRNPFRSIAAQRWPRGLVVAYPAPQNYVDRGSDGAIYCGIRPLHACRVELIFRRDQLLGANVRILHPGGTNAPEGVEIPEPALQRALSPF